MTRIAALARPTGPSGYYDNAFRVLVQSSLTEIWNSPTLRHIEIEPHKAAKYEGDFYGLLDDEGVDKQYHFAVLLTNHYKSPADYDPSRLTILLPDFDSLLNHVQASTPMHADSYGTVTPTFMAPSSFPPTQATTPGAGRGVVHDF